MACTTRRKSRAHEHRLRLSSATPRDAGAPLGHAALGPGPGLCSGQRLGLWEAPQGFALTLQCTQRGPPLLRHRDLGASTREPGAWGGGAHRPGRQRTHGQRPPWRRGEGKPRVHDIPTQVHPTAGPAGSQTDTLRFVPSHPSAGHGREPSAPRGSLTWGGRGTTPAGREEQQAGKAAEAGPTSKTGGRPGWRFPPLRPGQLSPGTVRAPEQAPEPPPAASLTGSRLEDTERDSPHPSSTEGESSRSHVGRTTTQPCHPLLPCSLSPQPARSAVSLTWQRTPGSGAPRSGPWPAPHRMPGARLSGAPPEDARWSRQRRTHCPGHSEPALDAAVKATRCALSPSPERGRGT